MMRNHFFSQTQSLRQVFVFSSTVPTVVNLTGTEQIRFSKEMSGSVFSHFSGQACRFGKHIIGILQIADSLPYGSFRRRAGELTKRHITRFELQRYAAILRNQLQIVEPAQEISLSHIGLLICTRIAVGSNLAQQQVSIIDTDVHIVPKAFRHCSIGVGCHNLRLETTVIIVPYLVGTVTAHGKLVRTIVSGGICPLLTKVETQIIIHAYCQLVNTFFRIKIVGILLSSQFFIQKIAAGSH